MADECIIIDPRRVSGGEGYGQQPPPNPYQPYPQYQPYPPTAQANYPQQPFQKEPPPQYPQYGPPVYQHPVQPVAEGFQNRPVTYYPPAQDVRREAPVYQQPAARQSTGFGGFFPGMNDDESGFAPSFEDKAVRQNFIAKVFSIVGLQLLFTTAVIAFCYIVKDVRVFLLRNAMPALIVAMVMYFVSALAIVCCQDLRRKHPWNFILLGFLTLGLTALTTVITATYSVTSILIAAGATCLIVFIIAVVSATNLIDITKFIGVLAILGIILMVFAVAAMITAFFVSPEVMRIIDLVYAGFATLVISLFLMFDIQSILGGRSIEISPEEYILAATQVYVNVVTLFLNVLVLVAGARGER